MRHFTRAFLLWSVVVLALMLGQAAGQAETRLALVVGNDEYKATKLATPANDAGLIANALQAAGFTVTGASNLDQATLRESLREFLDQVAAAGPDAVALIYLSGFGLQFQGENFFVPVDANLQRDIDVPLQTLRIADFAQPLSALPAQTKIVILDAARQNAFARDGQPLASGLALVDPAPSSAIAFNAAPGTVGADEQGPYGAYATALAEMIAAGGLGIDDLFTRVRLRVSEVSQGAEIPWFASQLGGPFFFTELAPDAPPPPNVMPIADLRSKPMRDYGGPEDAYAAALAMDSIDGYQQFLAVYPNVAYSSRVAAMLAVRREEIVWRRCVMADTPQAFWSYLRRYPRGPHVADAHRELMRLAAVMEPPPDFVVVDFGMPPPPPAELVYFERPVFMFVGPRFGPPPPPPIFFLPPRPREFAVLAPPPRPAGRFVLPTPVALPVAAFVRPPAKVVVQPALQGAAPGGRPAFQVSLPGAVQPGGSHAAPSLAPNLAPRQPATLAPVAPPHQGVPNAPATTAVVKPSPPPPHPAGPTPALAKPVPPPPHNGTAPAVANPAPPPPPHAASPAVVKPVPPPPPPPPAAAAAAKPVAPVVAPHAAGPAPTAGTGKPSTCPPGHKAVNVNGHFVCQ